MESNSRENRIMIIKTTALAILFAVLLFTRFYDITILPFGYHMDEAGAGYDARCLAGYGTDRYFKSWPLYLTNFGPGQSSLYAFICAFLFKIFGYSKFLLRLPAALFSVFTFIFGVDLTDRCFGKEKLYGILSGFLVVICPYFVLASRIGLDCNLMLGMSVIFLDIFALILEKEKPGLWMYALLGVIGGLVLYTYALSYIILPLFLLFMFLYTLRTKKFDLKGWLIMAVPLFILAFPLILIQFINIMDLPERRLGIFTLTKLIRYRGGEFEKPYLLKFNYFLEVFLKGDDLLFDSIPGFPNLYRWSIYLIPVGLLREIIRLIHGNVKRKYSAGSIVLLWFVSVFILENLISVATYTANAIFFSAVFMAVSALEGVVLLIKKIFDKNLKTVRFIVPVIPAVTVILYAIDAFGFFAYYYGEYTKDTYPQVYFGNAVFDAFEYIESDPVLSARETYTGEAAIYYLLESGASPHVVEDPENFTYNTAGVIGKYHFGALPDIEDGCNYVTAYGKYEEYKEELSERGFESVEFSECELWYKR